MEAGIHVSVLVLMLSPSCNVSFLSENPSLVLGTGTLATPQKHTAEGTPNLCTPQTFKSPLNFSTVTVEQLGITPESFVKNSSGKGSGHSIIALLFRLKENFNVIHSFTLCCLCYYCPYLN